MIAPRLRKSIWAEHCPERTMLDQTCPDCRKVFIYQDQFVYAGKCRATKADRNPVRSVIKNYALALNLLLGVGV